MERDDFFRAVCIGGGQGSGQVLLGLRQLTPNVTGIIAVTDTGRSTGVIRSLIGIPAPGDVRNVLATLADDDHVLTNLMQHRIWTDDPELQPLNGMAFGNLLLGTLAQYYISDTKKQREPGRQEFTRAIETARQMLDVDTRIIAVSGYDTHLCAELEDGTIVEEEVNVRGLNKPRIKRVFIQDPGASANTEAIDAILQADIITIGPGSFFTTVLADIAFPGIPDALARSNAIKVYICNTMTQGGQTEGFNVLDHVEALVRHVGKNVIDYAIINNGVPSDALLDQYRADEQYMLELDDAQLEAIRGYGIEPIVTDVIERLASKRQLWNKKDAIRHSPYKVASILADIVVRRRANGQH